MVNLNKKQKGFSLIELLVSISLFSVVLTIAVGTLLVLVDANGKAQNMQEAMTNLTFAMDSMTREIRTGRGYYCDDNTFDNDDLTNSDTRDCLTDDPGIQLSFVEGGSSLTSGQGSDRISYRFNQAAGIIERQVGDNDFAPLTSDSMNITDLRFTVSGSDTWIANDNSYPPVVTIYIEGSAGVLEGIDTGFELQTTITQRSLDI